MFKSITIELGNFALRLFLIFLTFIDAVLEAYAFVGAVGKTIYSFFWR